MTVQPLTSELRALRTGDLATVNGDAPRAAQGLSTDAKGKLMLPPVPEGDDPAALSTWLTVAFALDPTHPITAAAHEGLRGAAGHVELKRYDAPPLRFEPAARINTPMRLIEDLSWQAIPTDDPTPPYKGDHCRVIAHTIRRLCGASRAMTDEQETLGIVGVYLAGAKALEGHTTYGNGPQRYEAATALQREVDDSTGRPIGVPRYLIDSQTGELVIRVADLGITARQHVGSSLARGWLDARMENAGWTRVRLSGHSLPGREGRQAGTHARCDAYRGHLGADDDHDEAVNT